CRPCAGAVTAPRPPRKAGGVSFWPWTSGHDPSARGRRIGLSGQVYEGVDLRERHGQPQPLALDGGPQPLDTAQPRVGPVALVHGDGHTVLLHDPVRLKALDLRVRLTLGAVVAVGRRGRSDLHDQGWVEERGRVVVAVARLAAGEDEVGVDVAARGELDALVGLPAPAPPLPHRRSQHGREVDGYLVVRGRGPGHRDSPRLVVA